LREHATDMAVLALIQNYFEPGVAFAATQNASILGAEKITVT
jgi:hypothetical protein